MDSENGPCLAIEVDWQREKAALLHEVQRLRGEVDSVTRRYEREIADIVSRLQARSPPPVPVREPRVSKMQPPVKKKRRSSRRIVFARHPDLTAWSERSVAAEEWTAEMRLLEDPARKPMMVKKRGGGQVEVELLLRTAEAEDWEMMRVEFGAWMVDHGYGPWQRVAVEEGKDWDDKVRWYALQRVGLRYMLEEMRV